MGCSAVAVADPPPTARHGDGSDWKSRRCCGGRGSSVGGWRDEVEWLERVEKCGEDSPDQAKPNTTSGGVLGERDDGFGGVVDDSSRGDGGCTAAEPRLL
ncbi:hypothetical protein Tco_0923020 [Tanacetum coccineum]|uniref:Uncharacterized protein n=1 Tax=Tanacetum coccineum TaxID=301880 RepID=A0ABQ5CZT6_9ASTR